MTLSVKEGLANRIKNVENFEFILDCEGGEQGCLFDEIERGGKIKDCTVKGTIKNRVEAAGIMTYGEELTVEKCQIDLNVSGQNSIYYCLAINLGICTLKDVEIKGSVSNVSFGGIAKNIEKVGMEKVSVEVSTIV